MAGWLVHWFVGCWLVHSLVSRFVGWIAGWLVRSLVGSLVGWLVGGLVGWITKATYLLILGYKLCNGLITAIYIQLINNINGIERFLCYWELRVILKQRYWIYIQRSCFICNKRRKKWTNTWSHWRPCKNTRQPARGSARLLSSACMIDQATSETDRFPLHLFSARLKQIIHPEEGVLISP